jgi:hypothetical protein
MAALRGPSTTTRKSSRFSSPATTVPRTEREVASSVNDVQKAKEVPKTFLDQWVEPPLRAPAPSFEDHRGLERVGVLEHFQPLGQLPTPKLLQKLKLAPPRTGRATPVQNEEVSTPTTGIEEMSTASPAEEAPRGQSADENTTMADFVPPVRMREEKDTDYHPPMPSPRAIPRPKMPPQNNVSIPPTPLPSGGYLFHGHYHPETIRQHVEGAVRIAELRGPELAPGLIKLRADSELDPALWAVLDGIMNKSPTKEQWKVYCRYVRAGKKEYYSRHSTPSARATSLALATNNQQFTPTQHTTSAINYPAPAQLPASAPTLSQQSLQRPAMSHLLSTMPVQARSSIPSPPRLPPTQESANHQRQMLPSPTVTVTPVAEPPILTSPQQAADKASLVASSENTQSMNFQEGLQSLERTSQKRSRSVSSSSSLSSAKSLDAETFAPAINEEVQINGTKAAAKSGSDQRQAAAHKAGGNKSRAPKIGLFSIFPNTNKTNARKPAECEHDELELSRQRQRLQQNQSFHEDYSSRFHTGQSSERAELSAVPSRLIRPYSTPIQTPVIHPHNVTSFRGTSSSPADTLPPADLNLRNGTSKKRSRDDTELDDEELQTPRSSPGPLLFPPPPGAASISRSATPRGTRLPPSKKVKKSARVMVS